jgi:hypothetical protein
MKKVSRVAILYDVYGNLPALETVLSEVGANDHDLLVVGGEVASGPGPVGAFWALLGPEGVELHRSDYDLMGTVEGFRDLGYPGVEDLEVALLQPLDPAWVANFF